MIGCGIRISTTDDIHVLHETSDLDDCCDIDLLRPLTACGGDANRSINYLEWVHENQARRMKSRSEWLVTIKRFIV
uniref:Transposase n=1 Tax=Heterorhabditis bacteriophora TaxID=37862 RepID=A0A1I7XQ66_HETBA